ncbi:hypothetical protein [Curvibacter sp. PAE-UM]|uniref:hypothetical protein n=1 Tax=Curvibacter sp. PAE-UM TaxID=1714344 RepID=UPI00070BC537|nr:hypothetical protein [Curvibacter sp. PAE-UM]KRH99829.1 hypothetical protein AO057_16350 [Curvibacter sp. PAE-UM]
MLASKAGRGLLLVLVGGLVQAAEKDDALYASYACQQYALAALKTLGKPRMDATRPATPANDKRWAGMADVWLASGALHAQARFGAPMVRSEYQCAVQKTPGAGWKLLDLQWPQGRP